MMRITDNTKRKTHNPGNTKQRGAVLVVSLVVLLLLTMLGVSALNMSSMETLIARNDQQRQVSFQSAESALREGYIFAMTQVSPPIETGVKADGNSLTGLYVYDLASSSNLNIYTLSWDGTDSVSATNGRYVVEFLGERGPPSEEILYYRVVAHSSVGGTKTMLETTLALAKK